MQRWLIAAAVACAVLNGCTQAPGDGTTETTPRPQQAGQPINPWTTAGHLAAVDAAAMAGDQPAMRAHADAL